MFYILRKLSLVLCCQSSSLSSELFLDTLQQQILWQSYDHPTNTLMVLQALGSVLNLTSTSKTTNYTLAIENGTLTLYIKFQDSSGYGYPYFFWPLDGTQQRSRSYDHAPVVLCCDGNNYNSFHLDIVPLAITGLVLVICNGFPPHSILVLVRKSH